jgi:Tfp pilus assembly protein PilF
LDAKSLERMIESGRDSAMLRLTLAGVLIQDQQFDSAATHLESALEQDPNYTAAWKALGKLRNQMQQTDAALAAWQQGIKVAQNNGDKQAEKEMGVFVKRLLKTASG